MLAATGSKSAHCSSKLLFDSRILSQKQIERLTKSSSSPFVIINRLNKVLNLVD